MTDEQKANELRRLSQKLELWDKPGFFQFIEDLKDYDLGYLEIKEDIEELRKSYLLRLEVLLPKSKFTQTKLDI